MPTDNITPNTRSHTAGSTAASTQTAPPAPPHSSSRARVTEQTRTLVWLVARSMAVALLLAFGVLALASFTGPDLTHPTNPPATNPQPTSTVRHPVNALLRPVAVSTQLDATSDAAWDTSVSAPAAIRPGTSTATAPAALPAGLPNRATGPLTAAPNGPADTRARAVTTTIRAGDELEPCRPGRAPRWTDLSADGQRDRDRQLVINAGPIDVAIDLEVAARRACPNQDRDRERKRDRDGGRDRASERDERGDRGRNAEPTSNRDSDRDDCHCWPPRGEHANRSGWYRDGTDGTDRAETRPTHYNRPRFDPQHRDEPLQHQQGGEICRSYGPGQHPQLPDGGLICIHPQGR